MMQTTRTLSTAIVARFQSVMTTERGAGMVEYALLIGLIALVAIVSVTAFGGSLGSKNEGISGSIQDAIANR